MSNVRAAVRQKGMHQKLIENVEWTNVKEIQLTSGAVFVVVSKMFTC